jgi:hypothetical protein
VELLRDTRAAYHLSALLDVDLEAGHGQIGRTSQPIMAGANYDRIEINHDSARKGFCGQQGNRQTDIYSERSATSLPFFHSAARLLPPPQLNHLKSRK